MKKTIILSIAMLVTGLAPTIGQITPNDPAMIAYYSFDGDASDLSSNGFDGTLVGNPTYVADRNGNANSAFNFNSASYFLVNNVTSAFKPTTFPVTISCWLKIPAQASGQITFFKNDFAMNVYSGIRGTIIPDGKVTISLENGGAIGFGSRHTKTGTTNVKDGNWHLITCIIRGFNNMDIYVDCANNGGTYSGGGQTLSYSAANPGIIGAYDGVLGNNNFEYSNGIIDELIFLGREMTAAEIANRVGGQNASISGNTLICPGTATLLTASGGTSYLWDNGSTEPQRSINTPGNYTVTVSNGNCATSVSTTVNQVSVPNVMVMPSGPTAFCEGGSVSLNAISNSQLSPFSSIIWNDDNTDNPRVVNIPGEYYVRNVNGCPTQSNAIQVSQYPNPAQPVISPSGNITITAGSNVTFTSSAASAYVWQPNGETTSSITVSEEGAFRVQIFDENGCTATSEEVTVSVIAPPPPPLNTCSAVEVMDYAPKKRNDGSTLPPSRTVSTRALFDPQNSDLETSEENLNFVALGFGGSIVLRMSGAVANGPGDDIQVFETTFTPDAGRCNRYPEKVRVYASQDNCNWVYLGEGCQDVSVDLGVLNWAEFIRLEDVSPVDHPFNNSVADGYDVDGVVCLNGTVENPIAQNLGGMYATEVSSFEQLLRRDGSAVPLSRSNPALALGAPQNTNVVNFVSLGFGGAITLKLGYVVFDKEGNDIQVVETSFGNPVCTSYPEKASVQVSLDGVNFTDLGEICQDGSVDFASAGINAVHYVRIQDRTMASYFSGSADAYDVDGIVVLQPGCNTTSAPLAKWEDNIQTPDEVQLMNAQAQWQQDQIKLTLSGSDKDEQAVVTVLSLDGKEMYRGLRQIPAGAVNTDWIAATHLASGIYVVRVQTETSQVFSKVVKP